MTVINGVVEQRYNVHAAPETVFRFFADPPSFARWWAAPGGGAATIQPQPGGAVSIRFQGGTVMRGEVLDLTRSTRFALTWGYEGKEADGVGPGASRVDISLSPTADGTTLWLRHTGLPTPDQQHGHDTGWRHYLSVLATASAREQFEAGADDTLRAYAAAWSAKSPEETARFLEQCAHPEIEFRDLYACISGRDALAAHIANVKRHVPGHALELAGPGTLSHGYVRMPWRAMAAGSPMASGHNFCRLGPDGKLVEVIGFWDTAPGA